MNCNETATPVRGLEANTDQQAVRSGSATVRGELTDQADRDAQGQLNVQPRTTTHVSPSPPKTAAISTPPALAVDIVIHQAAAKSKRHPHPPN
jgi:hypothetical protein